MRNGRVLVDFLAVGLLTLPAAIRLDRRGACVGAFAGCLGMTKNDTLQIDY